MDTNSKLLSIYDAMDKIEMGNSLAIFNNLKFAPIFHEPYRLQDVVITHCTRGNFIGTRNTMPIRIKAPCLIQFLPNDILQSCEVSDDIKLETIVISVEYAQLIQTMDYLQPFILLRRSPVIPLTDCESEIVKYFFQLLTTLLSNKKDYAGLSETVRSLFDSFLHVVKSFNAMIQKETNTVSYNEELYQRFCLLVIKEHVHSRQVKYYADKLCMTPKYMARIIKTVSGRTATDWINRYVILEAKYYLRYRSDLTIENISGLLGFPNPSFFGKFFKAQIGETPGKYRKRS